MDDLAWANWRRLLRGEDIENSLRCEACRDPLDEEVRFSAHWDKVERRVSFCRDCLGEIFFDVLPVVTDPTPDTPSGRGSPLGEPDPWQENAIRALEEANDQSPFNQERRMSS